MSTTDPTNSLAEQIYEVLHPLLINGNVKFVVCDQHNVVNSLVTIFDDEFKARENTSSKPNIIFNPTPRPDINEEYIFHITCDLRNLNESSRPKYVLLVIFHGHDTPTQAYRESLKALKYRKDVAIFKQHAQGLSETALFVAECRHAHAINKAYYQAVNSLVASIFGATHDIGGSTPMSTTGLFQRVANVICAVAILPFDRHYTYAQYTSFPGGKDDKLPEHKLLLTASPIIDQYDFDDGTVLCPAPALHTCLLSEGSIANLVPLHMRQNFLFHRFPSSLRTAIQKEKEYLDACKKATTHEELYFITPIFAGKVPLFCLITELGSTLPVNTTHQDVYDEILLSWRNVIQNSMQHEVIQALLDNFVANAYRNITSSEPDLPNVERIIEEYWKHANEKPWHSWAHTVPTLTIGESLAVRYESEQIDRQFNKALDKLRKSPLRICTAWASEMHFFAKDTNVVTVYQTADGHDKVTLAHRERASVMARRASSNQVNDISKLDVENIDDSFKTYLTISDKHKDKKEFCKELKWLIRMITLACRHADKNPDYYEQPPTVDHCRTGGPHDECPTYCKAYLESNEAYLKAKSVFCGSYGGEGDTIRFSAWRILCLIEMYANADQKLHFHPRTKKGNISLIDTTKHYDDDSPSKQDKYIKYNVDGDLTELLAEFLKLIVCRCKAVNLQIKEESRDGTAATVKFTLSLTVTEDTSKGADCGESMSWLQTNCSGYPTAMDGNKEIWGNFKGQLNVEFLILHPLEYTMSGLILDSKKRLKWTFPSGKPFALRMECYHD